MSKFIAISVAVVTVVALAGPEAQAQPSLTVTPTTGNPNPPPPAGQKSVFATGNWQILATQQVDKGPPTGTSRSGRI